MTETLLDLVGLYSDWLERKKNELRKTAFLCYASPRRFEKKQVYYLKISDFIQEYNASKPEEEALEITSPQTVFLRKNTTDEAFHFPFPQDAEWVIKLEY
jgi:hypothetical protein